MFTGIIQEKGSVAKIDSQFDDIRFLINANNLELDGVEIGASISVNGVCLTVVEFTDQGFWVDISKETLEAANLSYDASQTAFEGTKIEQEVGERTILDVLNSRQSLLNAEIKFFNEQKNQEVIKAQILYLAGILTLEQIREG